MPKPSEIREIALSNTRFLSPPTVPPVGGAMLSSNQTPTLPPPPVFSSYQEQGPTCRYPESPMGFDYISHMLSRLLTSSPTLNA